MRAMLVAILGTQLGICFVDSVRVSWHDRTMCCKLGTAAEEASQKAKKIGKGAEPAKATQVLTDERALLRAETQEVRAAQVTESLLITIPIPRSLAHRALGGHGRRLRPRRS